jgi:VanZ family protein
MQSTGAVPPPQRYRMVWRWSLVVVYAACIFVLSSIPGHAFPGVRISDKLIHIGEYGLLGVLLCRALGGHLIIWPRARIALWSAVIASLYGATDELHQLFVPQRVADLSDLAADGLGAMLAAWGWLKASTRWTWVR